MLRGGFCGGRAARLGGRGAALHDEEKCIAALNIAMLITDLT
jgi:hypothetical protein